MKKLLIGLALVCGNASANDFCNATSNFAETVMEFKQNGVPHDMSKKAFTDTTSKSSPVYEQFLTIIDWAYVRPMYESQTDKQNEVDAFKGEVNKACMEVYKEGKWKR